MRPVLNPALSRTWRDDTTLQIGTDPENALVISGIGSVETTLLAALDGCHDLPALRQLAVEIGDDPGLADQFVDTLTAAGVVVDHDMVTTLHNQAPLPDMSTLGLLHRGLDGGRSAFQTRSRLRVDIHGAGRVGASIARLLAAAGLGEVIVIDPIVTEPGDVHPGGIGSAAVGGPRGRAAEEAALADATATTAPATGSGADRPDLVVLALPAGAGRAEAADLLRLGVPHLLVQIIEITGVVGPLVVPGESSCLRCHDLHRTDRDPHWPAILDQLARQPSAAPACDTALAATVAGLAGVQVLSFLEGFTTAAVDGTIDIGLPYGLPRRRSWPRHPDCGCAWEHLETPPAGGRCRGPENSLVPDPLDHTAQ